MSRRAIILVLDSFGIGATADAAQFGDAGADTLGHIAEACAAGRADKSGARYALIALLAVGMGVQNATARRLAVAELTTTVLTLTLTGIAADSWLGGGSGARTARRVIAVAAMLLGAILGALLLLQLTPAAPLALAAAILVAVAGVGSQRSRVFRYS